MANPKKLTALEHLQLLAEQTKKQADTLQENENALSGRIKAIEDAGPEKNVIETVKVNGTVQTVTNKAVNLTVPTKTSDLTNDSGYQNGSQVDALIKKAISESGHASFERVDAVPGVASAAENVMYLVLNTKTKHYDIYAKVKSSSGSYTMELLDDTTVDLSGKVDREDGKSLMSDAEHTKLQGIAEGANNYTHPAHTAYATGLYKITVDALGHITAATKATKEDITALGIPAQDTTYPLASSTQDGLYPHTDKAKLDSIDLADVRLATDDEVKAMLTSVFGS